MAVSDCRKLEQSILNNFLVSRLFISGSKWKLSSVSDKHFLGEIDCLGSGEWTTLTGRDFCASFSSLFVPHTVDRSLWSGLYNSFFFFFFLVRPSSLMATGQPDLYDSFISSYFQLFAVGYIL